MASCQSDNCSVLRHGANKYDSCLCSAASCPMLQCCSAASCRKLKCHNVTTLQCSTMPNVTMSHRYSAALCPMSQCHKVTLSVCLSFRVFSWKWNTKYVPEDRWKELRKEQFIRCKADRSKSRMFVKNARAIYMQNICKSSLRDLWNSLCVFWKGKDWNTLSYTFFCCWTYSHRNG